LFWFFSRNFQLRLLRDTTCHGSSGEANGYRAFSSLCPQLSYCSNSGEAMEHEEYKNASHPTEYLHGRIVWGLIEGSKARIRKNDGINVRKVNHLQRAYGLASAAFLLDILFMILFLRLY
jgi:hypothetical protein